MSKERFKQTKYSIMDKICRPIIIILSILNCNWMLSEFFWGFIQIIRSVVWSKWILWIFVNLDTVVETFRLSLGLEQFWSTWLIIGIICTSIWRFLHNFKAYYYKSFLGISFLIGTSLILHTVIIMTSFLIANSKDVFKLLL